MPRARMEKVDRHSRNRLCSLMLFNSVIFVVFSIVFFALWPFVKKTNHLRWIALVAASFIFYGWSTSTGKICAQAYEIVDASDPAKRGQKLKSGAFIPTMVLFLLQHEKTLASPPVSCCGLYEKHRREYFRLCHEKLA